MEPEADVTPHVPSTGSISVEKKAGSPPSRSSLSIIQKKGGRLLSVLVAINMLLIGCALVSSGGLSHVAIRENEVLFLLTSLMLLAIICMLLLLYYTFKNQAEVLYKDSHAGPIWLRGGLIFFGVFILLQDVFKIGYSLPLYLCESPIKIIYPVMQAAFVIIQTYFLWVSCKKCIQFHTNLVRYSLMLILVTNLIVWMAAVTDESNHHSEEEEEHRFHQALLHKQQNRSMEDNHTSDNHRGALPLRGAMPESKICYCNSSLCHIFENGYYYMYPFNIEYSLFASTLTYIMWRNVGRLVDDNIQHKRPFRLCFCMPTYFVGIICGLAVLLFGLVTLIFFKVNKEDDDPKILIMLYIFSICSLGVMSLLALVGSVIYRFDTREMVNHKNPSRTLDVTLLLGAALGQYCISYYSIVAIIADHAEELMAILNLLYSLTVIFQHTFQNVFIIEGLHRQPYDDTELQDDKNPPDLFYANSHIVSHLPDGDSSPLPAHTAQGKESSETSPPRTPTNEMCSSVPSKNKIHWQRRILREILLFLLLCNFIFWILPAFGARPQLKNNLEERFYGRYMWDIIVNVCLPFGIFYRLHSVASLLEVYIKT
ncbi:proton channel OTOP2-like isoform X1 [Pleurodeles waltl]